MISSGIIWFMSKRITKPLLELTEISRRMSNLDFEPDMKAAGRMRSALWGRILIRCPRSWNIPYPS